MSLPSDNEIEEYLHDMDDVVLYDVFYEAGTILSGVMLAIEREYRRKGDIAAAEKMYDESVDLQRVRQAVEPNDVDRQIACKITWTKRTAELRDFLHGLTQN